MRKNWHKFIIFFFFFEIKSKHLDLLSKSNSQFAVSEMSDIHLDAKIFEYKKKKNERKEVSLG